MNKYAELAPSRRSKKRAIAAHTRGAATMCLRKHSFTSEDKANTRAAEITATGTTMRAYKCPHCLLYHLTSKPQTRDMRKDNSHG